MPCNLTLTGISYDCSPNLSGVKKIYVNNYADVTVTPSGNGMADVSLNGEKFAELVFAKNTASYTSTLTKDETKGTKYYNTELVANFNHLDASKNTAFSGDIDEVGLDGAQMIFIVVDKNNHNWVLGAQDYATVTALTAQTGAAADDGNFYSLTVTAQSGRLPYEIDASTLATLI